MKFEVFREAVGVGVSGWVNGKGGEALKVTHYYRSGSSVKLLYDSSECRKLILVYLSIITVSTGWLQVYSRYQELIGFESRCEVFLKYDNKVNEDFFLEKKYVTSIGSSLGMFFGGGKHESVRGSS